MYKNILHFENIHAFTPPFPATGATQFSQKSFRPNPYPMLPLELLNVHPPKKEKKILNTFTPPHPTSAVTGVTQFSPKKPPKQEKKKNNKKQSYVSTKQQTASLTFRRCRCRPHPGALRLVPPELSARPTAPRNLSSSCSACPALLVRCSLPEMVTSKLVEQFLRTLRTILLVIQIHWFPLPTTSVHTERLRSTSETIPEFNVCPQREHYIGFPRKPFVKAYSHEAKVDAKAKKFL